MSLTAMTVGHLRLAGRVLVLSGVALALVASAGCRRQPSAEDSRRYIADAYGRLPGLAETPDPELQAELARIIEEEATPELLARSEVPGEENVANGLVGLFPPEEIAGILETSSHLLPAGKFQFDPTQLERAIRFREQHETARRRAREATGRPKCSFRVDFEAGFAADLSLVDAARICARLEAFWAAEALARDDLGAAIVSLGSMLRLAECLAAEKHPSARLQGALCRAEALAVLQAIVEHPETSRPSITREQLLQLYALVEDQLKSWPPDRDAWIGDRAVGLHAYELVRAGLLLELLTEDEIRQFAEEGILSDLPSAAQRNVNRDELYYLETTRKIIEACDQPYYKRADVFTSIRQRLHENRNSPQFPLVAGRLLLVDVENGHALQAHDRANCEAWALALAAASGQERPPYEISPLSGQVYQIVRKEGLVEVWGVADDERVDAPPVVVPDLARQEGPQ